jgi:hypothetical protein
MITPEINGNGEICLNVLDIFYSTSDSFKLELVERLSCEDAVIKHVIDQVLNGCTENGYSGSEVIDSQRVSSELQQARERIRQQGNNLLVKELNRLREQLENRSKYQDSGWNEYHKLYNQVYRTDDIYL